jgi:predicted small secreted protein
MMKRRRFAIGIAVCLVLLAVVLTGCGETAAGPTTTSPSGTAATTAAVTSSSATTAAANATALGKYKDEMKAWVDKYDAELTKSVEVLGTITDPMTATEDQIKGARAFQSLMAKAASDLQEIQPPADLASDHKAYADGVTTMSVGLAKYVKAMEDASTTGLADALASMSVSEQINQAETALEQVLGFKLSAD